MSEFDQLRKVLNSKAVAAANEAGIQVQLPNEAFDPPKRTIYGSFWFKTGGSKQIELGGGKSQELTVGIFQFDLLAPEKTSDGPATQLADMIRRRFNRKEWLVAPNGYVKLLVANVKTPFQGAVDGFYRCCVDGTFHFYHRDPNPLAFDA
jgi:hypothetical protein